MAIFCLFRYFKNHFNVGAKQCCGKNVSRNSNTQDPVKSLPLINSQITSKLSQILLAILFFSVKGGLDLNTPIPSFTRTAWLYVYWHGPRPTSLFHLFLFWEILITIASEEHLTPKARGLVCNTKWCSYLESWQHWDFPSVTPEQKTHLHFLPMPWKIRIPVSEIKVTPILQL